MVMKKIYFISFVFGVIFMVLSPWIFTRPALIDNFDFSTSGQIGDTIGGITAPIISLIGAVLVYLSFRAQIEANNNQEKALKEEISRNKKERNFEIIMQLLKEEKEDLKSIIYIKNKKEYFGRRSINVFRIDLKKSENYTNQTFFKKMIFNDLKYVVDAISFIKIKIDEFELFENDKIILLSKLESFFETNLKTQISDILDSKTSLNIKKRPKFFASLELSLNIFDLKDSINADSINTVDIKTDDDLIPVEISI